MRHSHTVRRIRGLPLLTLLAAMLSLLVGCSTSSATVAPTSPPPTLTALPTGTSEPQPVPLTALLAPAPTNCTAVAPPDSFTSSSFGGGFVGPTTFSGGAPAWNLGLSTEPLHLNDLAGGVTPYPETKIMWVVGPDYTQPVTLSGHDTLSGAPLWFEVYAVATNAPPVYTTHAVLDPAAPNRGAAQNSTGKWSIWGVGLMALSAGCYELDVSASGAGWHTTFAIGR